MAAKRSKMRRWLKEQGWRWNRCRRSLKEKRGEAEFLEGKRILQAFHEREVFGELDVLYLDESGFSSRSGVRLAAQGRNLTPTRQCAGSNQRHRFMSRNNEAYLHTVDGSVTH